MMFCKECGTQIEAGAVSCSSCGKSVKEPMEINDTLSLISVICGVLSLLVGGTICPIAAVVCGAIVLNKDKQDKKALVGVILGAIELVFQIVAVVAVVIIYIAMFIFMFYAMSMSI